MASQTDICNRALQKLGAPKITSIDEDSVAALSCLRCYELLRDKLLEAYTWKFSIERTTLAADATDPDWGRAQRFALPADFLRLYDDYPEDAQHTKDWEIEGGYILTDETDTLYLRYIKRVEDTSLFPPTFVDALASEMAYEMCEELTQSNTKKAALKNDKEDAIALAKRTNAIQRRPVSSNTDPWITVRS